MHSRGTPARPLSEAEMFGEVPVLRGGSVGQRRPPIGAEAAVADLESLADIRDLLRRFQPAPN